MLALIAGTGALPVHLMTVLAAQGRGYVSAALQGFAPAQVAPDHLSFRLETLGTLLQDLRARDVTQVCFAGAIQRPSFDPTQLDAATIPLVPQMQQALARGDDGALRIVLSIFETAGFEIVSATQIAPDLLPDAGVWGDALPDTLVDEAAHGQRVLDGLAPLDLGQGCVVRRGQVLAVEALPGTDWMLRSLAAFDATGGVFCKAPKQGQDLRVDRPAIGPETVDLAHQAGLAAIVIEAQGVMVLHPDQTRARAAALNLPIWIRPRG